MQGDTISGRLSRADVATVVLAALKRPAAANTTFEARRTKRCAVGGPETFDDTAQSREFLKLSQGAHHACSVLVLRLAGFAAARVPWRVPIAPVSCTTALTSVCDAALQIACDGTSRCRPCQSSCRRRQS